MTINSVGFIVTPKGKPGPFVVARKVEKAINKVMGELAFEGDLKLDANPLSIGNMLRNPGLSKYFSTPEVIIRGGSNTLTFLFKSEGVQRGLSCFYACDSDYSEIRRDEKIIFLIGHDNQGVRYIEAVLDEFKDDYECLLCPNEATPEWSLWKGRCNAEGKAEAILDAFNKEG